MNMSQLHVVSCILVNSRR